MYVRLSVNGNTGTHLINRKVATFAQDRRSLGRLSDIDEIASNNRDVKNYKKIVLEWTNAAKSARKKGTIHADRPLPNELVTKRDAFQEWWYNTSLKEKRKIDDDLLFDALSFVSRLYRMQERQSESKPSATTWSENAIDYFEQIQNPEYLVESLLDRAAIYLELSQIEHTEAKKFRNTAEEGDSTMARAASLASDSQKPEVYRTWSRFYYNLARPQDGILSDDWDNNYLFLSYQKMQAAFDMQPEQIENATQLARITQKLAANPPQNEDHKWTRKLRKSQQALIEKWEEKENNITTPKNRIPPLNIIAVITLDLVRRKWTEAEQGNIPAAAQAIAELENIALPAQREVLALVQHTEWAEDYDFDISYDLGRIYSLIVVVMDSIDSERAEGMFREAINNMKTAREGGSATQNDSAFQSIDGDSNLSLLNESRKVVLREIFSN